MIYRQKKYRAFQFLLFWVQQDVGVGATGIGEAITRAMLSYRVADRISSGDGLMDAVKSTLDEFIDNESEVGIIALGIDGPGVGHSNRENMPWATWCAE